MLPTSQAHCEGCPVDSHHKRTCNVQLGYFFSCLPEWTAKQTADLMVIWDVMMLTWLLNHDLLVQYYMQYLPRNMHFVCAFRDHFVYACSKWEMAWQFKIVSYWLGTYTKSSLALLLNCCGFFLSRCYANPSRLFHSHYGDHMIEILWIAALFLVIPWAVKLRIKLIPFEKNKQCLCGDHDHHVKFWSMVWIIFSWSQTHNAFVTCGIIGLLSQYQQSFCVCTQPMRDGITV